MLIYIVLHVIYKLAFEWYTIETPMRHLYLIVYSAYQKDVLVRSGIFYVYHKKVLHGHFNHTIENTLNKFNQEYKLLCTMGRLGLIMSNIQRLSCRILIHLAVFFHGMV